MILYLLSGDAFAPIEAIDPIVRRHYGDASVRTDDLAGETVFGTKYEINIHADGVDSVCVRCLKNDSLIVDGSVRPACEFALLVYSALMTGKGDAELCDDDGEFGVRMAPELDVDTLAGLFEDYQ